MDQTTHLFYQQTEELPIVERAAGCMIWDKQGKAYLDACSGAIVCNLGHGNKRIIQAMKQQLDNVAFTYRTQFESESALLLAAELAELSADHLNKVFFVSSGSEAVESAMKLAKQYYESLGESQRSLFISLRTSYHGSTLGALSLTGYQPLEKPFLSLLQNNPKIPSPEQYRIPEGLTPEEYAVYCADELEKTILEYGSENIAGFFLEPVGGASTGARVPLPVYFEKIQAVCKRYGVLLILDEVLTGFGRTGRWFAYQHWNLEADIVALAKGMGAGYYPVGAIIARNELVEKIMADQGFMHGHTYAGNPLACATGLAAIQVMKEEKLVERAEKMGHALRKGLNDLAERHEVIGNVRGIGLLQCLEFVENRENRQPFPPAMNVAQHVTQKARLEGLLVYPRRCINGTAGDHILISPPLVIDLQGIDFILEKLDNVLAKLSF